MAILFGVKLMFEYDWLNIIVKIDCKTAIKDISNYWEERVWIEDIVDYVNMCESISFNFIRKEVNQLAHKLAKR